MPERIPGFISHPIAFGYSKIYLLLSFAVKAFRRFYFFDNSKP